MQRGRIRDTRQRRLRSAWGESRARAREEACTSMACGWHVATMVWKRGSTLTRPMQELAVVVAALQVMWIGVWWLFLHWKSCVTAVLWRLTSSNTRSVFVVCSLRLSHISFDLLVGRPLSLHTFGFVDRRPRVTVRSRCRAGLALAFGTSACALALALDIRSFAARTLPYSLCLRRFQIHVTLLRIQSTDGRARVCVQCGSEHSTLLYNYYFII